MTITLKKKKRKEKKRNNSNHSQPLACITGVKRRKGYGDSEEGEKGGGLGDFEVLWRV